jgi:hypothetical protein
MQWRRRRRWRWRWRDDSADTYADANGDRDGDGDRVTNGVAYPGRDRAQPFPAIHQWAWSR